MGPQENLKYSLLGEIAANEIKWKIDYCTSYCDVLCKCGIYLCVHTRMQAQASSPETNIGVFLNYLAPFYYETHHLYLKLTVQPTLAGQQDSEIYWTLYGVFEWYHHIRSPGIRDMHCHVQVFVVIVCCCLFFLFVFFLGGSDDGNINSYLHLYPLNHFLCLYMAQQHLDMKIFFTCFQLNF